MVDQFSFKFVLVGDSAVGKTAMCRKFCENIFDNNQAPTVGLEFGIRNLEIQGKKIKLQIWDTAGQERFRSITNSYFRSAVAVFLVFDVTSRESFSNLDQWCDNAEKGSPSSSIKVLVGNKTDLDNRQVSTAEASDFANQHGLKYYETSALSGDRIDETFVETAQQVFKKVTDHILDPLPPPLDINISPQNNRESNGCFSC